MKCREESDNLEHMLGASSSPGVVNCLLVLLIAHVRSLNSRAPKDGPVRLRWRCVRWRGEIADMRTLRIALAITVATVAVVAAITLVALEGGEVVVLRTIDEHGAARATRTWAADADGTVLIEAANPQRPFLLQLQAHPDVELQRSGVVRRCHATVLANPDGHGRIRRLLAEKYGWRDRWIGLLTDTSASLAVGLHCG